MTKLVLKGVAVLLILTVGAILFVYLNRSDPLGRVPGKRLLGEEVAGPIADWSFTEVARVVILEVRPSAPYSVIVSCLNHDGTYYGLATSIQNRWVQYLIEDPNIRFKVEDAVYPARADMVEDPRLISDLFDALAQKYRGGRDWTPEQRAPIDLFELTPAEFKPSSS